MFDFSDDLLNNLSGYTSNVLTNLYLQHEDIDSMNTLSFKNLVNLTHFNCYQIKLNDNQMQEICKNLKQLKHFVFENSSLLPLPWVDITDFGFTGEMENNQIGYSISNLKYLKVLHISLEDSCLGDSTLLHIMKIKGLEYLYIKVIEVRYMHKLMSLNAYL